MASSVAGPARAAGGRLSRHVYEELKLRLLQGRYAGGSTLSVEALRAEFAVSKQPIMEAMRLLSADGLVEIFPQVGCVVPAYSVEEARDFFRVFAALESSMASMAARRRSESDLAELAAAAQWLRALEDEPDPGIRAEGYRTGNRQFHQLIHEMSGSRVMLAVSRRMWDLADFLMNTAGPPHVVANALSQRNDDHERIIAALRVGDAEVTRAEMEGHILMTAHILSAAAEPGQQARPAG